MIKQIPNLFTLGNLFFGCCAIVFILQSGDTLIRLNQNQELVIYLPEKIWFASLFIALAAVMDFLDGFVARYLKVSSELGKQLDSLSDVVSFGVAPALIFYQLLRVAFIHQFDSLTLNWFFLSPAFLLACFAAYRLGKFNLDARQTTYFVGMPTPAVGFFVASLPIIVWLNEWNINAILLKPITLYALIFLLCYLMVSEIKFISFKFKKPFLKNTLIFIFIISIIAFIIFFHWMGIALGWVFYVLLSIFSQKQIN